MFDFSAKIGLFYLIFYSCLAGFFAIMLTGFFTTLSDNHPKQTGLFSLIKSNPGRPTVAFLPRILCFSDIGSLECLVSEPHITADHYVGAS